MRAAKAAVDRVLAVLTAVFFAVLVIVVAWQVFTRLVLNSPSTWSEEFARYAFVWVALIAAALVFGERGHIAVTFVVDRMPRGVRKVVAVAIQLIIAALAIIVFIWGGIGAAQNTWLQNLTALPMQIGHMYLVMPIAGAFILFYAIYNIWEDLRGEGPLTVDDPTAEVDADTEAALAKAQEIETQTGAETKVPVGAAATTGAAAATGAGVAADDARVAGGAHVVGDSRVAGDTRVGGTPAAGTTLDPDPLLGERDGAVPGGTERVVPGTDTRATGDQVTGDRVTDTRETDGRVTDTRATGPVDDGPSHGSTSSTDTKGGPR